MIHKHIHPFIRGEGLPQLTAIVQPKIIIVIYSQNHRLENKNQKLNPFDFKNSIKLRFLAERVENSSTDTGSVLLFILVKY